MTALPDPTTAPEGVPASDIPALSAYQRQKITQPPRKHHVRLAEAGALASVGSIGDCYDDAIPKSLIGITSPNASAGTGRRAPSRTSSL
jgi:hypothetical protein